MVPDTKIAVTQSVAIPRIGLADAVMLGSVSIAVRYKEMM